MSSGFGRIEYDGNVIEFTRPWTDFQARRPIKSSTIQSGSGLEETLFGFAQWFINARLNLADPKDKQAIQRLYEYAQGGGSFTLIRNKDLGVYMNFDGGENPAAAPRGLKTNDDAPGTLAITGANDAAYYLDRATGFLKLAGALATDDVPRFEAGQSGAGLLQEGARTNLCTHPSSFDNAAWVKTSMTVLGTNTLDTLDPTGVTFNAEKLQASGSNGEVKFTTGTAIGNFVSFGIWLKCQNGTVSGIIGIQGTTGGSNNIGVSVTSVWQRFEINGIDTTAYTGDIVVKFSINVSTNIVYAWGGQIEDDAEFLSNPIGVASVTSITRAAEKLTIPSANVIDKEQGTILIKLIPKWTAASLASGVHVFYEGGDSVGAFGNIHLRVFWSGATDRLTLEVFRDNSSPKGIDYTPAVASGFVAGTAVQLAITWDSKISNGGHIYVDSAELASGSSNSAFNVSEPEDTIAIGSELDAANPSFCLYDEILIMKTVLSLAEISTLNNIAGIGSPRNRWTVKLMNPNFDPRWLQSDIYDIPMAFKEVLT